MRKLVIVVVAGALTAGGVAPQAVADEPSPSPCQAQFVAESVQPSAFGPGRRAVATQFFGDYPQAVKDAEEAVQAFCAAG
jgi:hypothetical protein